MKKILKIFLLLFVLGFAKTNVLAEENYIYLGDKIPGIRLYLKTPTVEKYKNMYEIINRDTGEYVYCIEPGVVLKNGNFKAYQDLSKISHDLGITNEDWNYLRTIAYYGYGYRDRSDIKWYAATQFMIWEYLLEGKGEIYFVDQNNQKIDLLKEEIDAIKKDLEIHKLMPSFLENASLQEVKIGDTLTYIDENHILEDFRVTVSDIDYKIEGNKLTLTFDTPGYQMIGFKREMGTLAIPKIFYSPSNQAVMGKGIVNRNYQRLEFQVSLPSFTLKKKSNEESSLSLEGAKYGIYYENGNLYQTIVTDSKGEAFLEEIPLGKYYLQEIEAPYGYCLNDEKVYFEVKDKDVVLEVEDEVIKKKIVIEKYLENYDGSLELEVNAEFQVLDLKGNVVTTFKTNEYGKFAIFLPYGEYVIKQITSKEGYQLAEDISLIVNEDTNLEPIVIKNPQIVGSLRILKKDQDTKELIVDGARFKIRNVDTNQFLQINGNEVFDVVDGVLLIENLCYGNYELIEVEAPNHYQILEESIFFQIRGEEEITLEVFNQLQNGMIQIEKLDETTLKPLQGVLFGFYDQDKNLIETFQTDEKGIITIENLVEGLYYIQELEVSHGYERLNGFLSVSVKNNILNTIKVTNRLKIEVPKTGVNDLFFTILFSSICLAVGAFLCNYD